MEVSHEAEVTQLNEVRRAHAIENSPFGPIQKFGESILRDTVDIAELTIPDESTIPFTLHRKKNGDLAKLYITTEPHYIELNQETFRQ